MRAARRSKPDRLVAMADGVDQQRRTLTLVRHAKSSWDDPNVPDHDRPLAPRGLKALGRIRDHIGELGIRPDVVLCSSAVRTRETLDGIREAFAPAPRIEIEDGLYGADADDLLGRLVRLGDEVAGAVVVGHNPGLADLLDLLVAGDDTPEAVPTGAVVVLSFDGPWHDLAPGTASLDSFWQPRPPR
jgi:phosphohistidine phosphatase